MLHNLIIAHWFEAMTQSIIFESEVFRVFDYRSDKTIPLKETLPTMNWRKEDSWTDVKKQLSLDKFV